MVSKNVKKEGMIVDRKYDWVIFDSTFENATSQNLQVAEKLLACMKNQCFLSYDGQKTSIPTTMSFIFKCDTIQSLSPASLSDLTLLYTDELCQDLDMEFNNWMASLSSSSTFFCRSSTSSHATFLYKKIIRPVIDHAIQGARDNKLIFYLSDKYFLLHFMSFFEIFLNEARKLKVAFGQVSEDEIDEGARDNPPPEKRGARKSFFRRSFNHLDEAQNTQNTLNSDRRPSITPTTADDILKIKYYLEENPMNSPIDKLSFIIDKDRIILDSICIMSLVWTIGMAWNLKYRSEFSDFMLKLIHKYYRGSRTLDKLTSSATCILNKLPIDSFNHRPSKKTVFDFCFDINTQRWMGWKELRITEHPCITSSFQSVTLPAQELLRLNPGLAQIQSLKKLQSENKSQIMQTIYELGEPILVYSDAAKSLRFFLDFMIAYKRPILLASNYENGKSLVVRHKLKHLLEGNTFRHTNIAITPFTTQDNVHMSFVLPLSNLLCLH